MRPRSASIFCLSAFILAGCAGTPDADRGPSSSHGGVFVDLPDGLGLAEVLNGPAVQGGKRFDVPILVYLLKPGGAAALDAKATGMSVVLDPAKLKTPIPLKLDPDANDPLGAARYISEAGPYEINRGGGTVLEMTIDGKPIKVSFRGSR